MLVTSINENDIAYNENLIKKVYRSAEKTLNLLEELIQWTSSQFDTLPFEPEECSVKSVCVEIIDFLQQIADVKRIKIRQNIDEGIIAYADFNMLKAILRNLVSNSIKYTKTGGRIDISSKETQFDILISVSDNGIGMSAQRLSELFDISNVHSSKGTSFEKGSGLGLIICKELVEKHGGEINVESELGNGSTFNVVLPLKRK